MNTRGTWFRCCLFLAALAACEPQQRVAGIDGTGSETVVAGMPTTTYGTVTAFGSVWVNGARYDTSNANILVDGDPAMQTDLRVGDVVFLTGTLTGDGSNTAFANDIERQDIVRGPVSSIDAGGRSLVALGQRIRINDDTLIGDSAPRAALEVGDVISVAGFRLSDDAVSASRVHLEPLGGPDSFVTGTVTELDGSRFDIDSLVVDYGAATLVGFPQGEIRDGDVVLVRGVASAASELMAARVERTGGALRLTSDGHVELEGYVTAVWIDGEPNTFAVAGVTVRTNEETIFEGGAYVGLALDVRVEVEGSMTSTGIVASKVRFVRETPLRISALVDSVDLETGSIVALGTTIYIDVQTRILDSSSANLSPFALSDVAVGDYVNVHGLESSSMNGVVLASLFERTNAMPTTVLRGFVEPFDWINGLLAQPISILGVTVLSDQSTRYFTPDGSELSDATFWLDLEPGALLQVSGAEVGDRVILASSLRYIN